MLKRPVFLSGIDPEQQLRNVARVLLEYTEKSGRGANGRGGSGTGRWHYAQDIHAIAPTARQLAEMVLEYLDAGGVDHQDEPVGVIDNLPF